MLEVLPIQDKQEQEALCARCRIPFRTELLAYKALEEGELKGVCQFTLNADGGRIVDLAAIDNETLIKAIGFSRNNDGRFEMDLTDFFKEPCQHHKN